MNRGECKMITDWVAYFQEAASKSYSDMDQLAFQMLDADISPDELIAPKVAVEQLRAKIMDHVLDAVTEHLAKELTLALIEKVKSCG
jgi:hypothetical protein